MAVRLVVAVTDGDWYAHLRTLPNIPEVNFWAPSGSPFRALEPGELFLFKLHAPQNYIVGGGVFAHATIMPCSLAWETFKEANGARSLSEMRLRIAHYRDTDPADRSDFMIGCRVLTQPFFLSENKWLPVPPSWSRNIVSFKIYTSDEQDGRRLWEKVQEALANSQQNPAALPVSRYGGPQLIHPRLGQGAFRLLVTDLYSRRCAVTGERTLPALEAAHIRPFSDGGSHEPSNGLLLRRDIHSLFDAGYVTITPDAHFHVSKRIREQFENGRHYYELEGRSIELPERTEQRPERAALEWHYNERFLG
jgi:putative restriction endonuclease